MALTDFLTGIADAIRTKDGTADPIVANNFSERILALASGGGSNIAMGTFTPASKMETIEVDHGLSAMPYISLVIANTEITVDNGDRKIICTMSCPYTTYKRAAIRRIWKNIQVEDVSMTDVNDTYTDTSIIFNSGGTGAVFTAGITYVWVAVAVESEV